MNIEVAPKKAFIYVSRLKPGTKKQILSAYIKSHFPEAEVEELSSKFPEHYSSFKITVNLMNFEAATNTDLWPSGAYVSRFFHPRHQKNTGK